jgi:hypothetical protein
MIPMTTSSSNNVNAVLPFLGQPPRKNTSDLGVAVRLIFGGTGK